ncbi:hypothetical protein Y032_0268g792 [Ancylostoma ceylanicum]|uniref:Uncharacterized protein n=1 Tax=Ancylostoma ceylanicum TaxID=53326 RepID=A0A016S921_9BILA|nr:hypothetical protein Y032_0268g792 [Ancylostoma ceylanicum]
MDGGRVKGDFLQAAMTSRRCGLMEGKGEAVFGLQPLPHWTSFPGRYMWIRIFFSFPIGLVHLLGRALSTAYDSHVNPSGKGPPY